MTGMEVQVYFASEKVYSSGNAPGIAKKGFKTYHISLYSPGLSISTIFLDLITLPTPQMLIFSGKHHFLYPGANFPHFLYLSNLFRENLDTSSSISYINQFNSGHGITQLDKPVSHILPVKPGGQTHLKESSSSPSSPKSSPDDD